MKRENSTDRSRRLARCLRHYRGWRFVFDFDSKAAGEKARAAGDLWPWETRITLLICSCGSSSSSSGLFLAFSVFRSRVEKINDEDHCRVDQLTFLIRRRIFLGLLSLFWFRRIRTVDIVHIHRRSTLAFWLILRGHLTGWLVRRRGRHLLLANPLKITEQIGHDLLEEEEVAKSFEERKRSLCLSSCLLYT